jgi:hypothetical protein
MPKAYGQKYTSDFFDTPRKFFINRLKKETASLAYDDQQKNLAWPWQTRHILMLFPLNEAEFI